MDHKTLTTWTTVMELTRSIYSITQTFPKQEQYGITSQIRRAVISVPSNIAEGCARKSDKELSHFIHIALGSLAELETLILISSDLGYIEQTTPTELKITRLRKLLLGLRKYVTSPRTPK